MKIFSGKTGGLILIMLVVVAAGITAAEIYYSSINRGVDPRVRAAREMYSGYNDYAGRNDYEAVFSLLDSIEEVYKKVRHYSLSFESGVLLNNRAAALLSQALNHSTDISKGSITDNEGVDLGVDVMVSEALSCLEKAESIYLSWTELYSGMTREEVMATIRDSFAEGLEAYTVEELDRFIEARAAEIVNSVAETPRRLSVCYTNMGIIWRIQGDYKLAIDYYEKALSLWHRNLEAENNINRILGRPVRKRNIIQKLFPPDRED